ncbi:glycoside hydrolase family 127 protein [Tessaracoccus sp. OS52]|uniref:beta-L-arabinofuranosidase domain-containing protein n=1 Tax=Tessaracoccus sp. OS52 TaxID=2886691 RepID=UPI001D123D0F|nr:glycoside hydrolase family 127 protein [Tessaracoccus sp. OS52]
MPELQQVALDDVRIDDPYLVASRARSVDYLLSLEPARFLHAFQKQAGLTPSSATRYGGWEAETGTRFQGHFFGHYLSAVSQAYAVEAAGSRREALLAALTESVEGLAAAQQAYAELHPEDAGYVSAFPADFLPDGADGLLVPFYNLHKVLAGLLTAHRYAPTAVAGLALGVAAGFGTFVARFGDRQADPAALLRTEYGGMNEALYDLFALTRDPDHKRAAEYFDEMALFRELAEGRDVLAGLHANTTIPKLVGAMTRYELFTRDAGLRETLAPAELSELETYRRAAENFWRIVVEHHTYANGGNSCAEHFHEAGSLHRQGASGIAEGYGENSTSEGCNEYNMLKLTRALFRATGDVRYADYHESTLINSVLATQHPGTGMVTYFQPMAAGYAKVFGKPLDEFWCDHGTGVEKFTMLAAGFHFTDDHSVWVNDFHSCTVSLPALGLVLEQAGSVPDTDTVHFHVRAGQSGLRTGTALRLRIPGWLAGPPTLTVNGSERALGSLAADVDQVPGYASFTVAEGDRITWRLPARVAVDAGTENPDWVAFTYGPVLLAAELSRERVGETYEAGVLVRMSSPDKSLAADVVVPDAREWRARIAENLVRQDNFVGDDGIERMAFELRGTAADSGLLFEPYFSLYQARYAVYVTLREQDRAALVD